MLTGCEIQGLFQDLCYSVYKFSNELNRICFWEKIELPFLFSYIVTLKVLFPVMTNSSVSLFFTVKDENFPHSRIPFKDHNPNSRTFQGPRNFFANSRTFQDFQGLWQP